MYNPLGAGTRVSGGWRITGVQLPANQNLFVRARGYHPTGEAHGSGSVVESVRNVYVAASCAAVSPTSLSEGFVGAFYSQQFGTTGAVGAISWSITGTLPAGITFSAGGLLSGTPTQSGSFPLTVTATDAGNGCVINQLVTLVIDAVVCLTVSPTALSETTTGVFYAVQFSTTNAAGAVTWGLTGSLPMGMGFSPGGLLSGTPTVTGSFSLSVTATDAGNGCVVPQAVTLVVTAGAGQELIRNGGFAQGTQFWSLFATPDNSYLVHTEAAGLFEFYRVPPPAGTTNQAVVFQETGASVASGAPLVASFGLRNTSSVRKRISVLILDADFTDLAVCTFWLGPNTALATYGMRMRTTKAWANATINFYAASVGTHGGFYGIDNVSLQVNPAAEPGRTTCVDPTRPGPDDGGGEAAELLGNRDFSGAGLAPWSVFGQLTWQLAGGVFEFLKPPPPVTGPAGVVLQPTPTLLASRRILTAKFKLGNTGAGRKRVTVLLHDQDFSDLAACTFWLPPAQPLSSYAMQMFTTEAWPSPTLSLYPATAGSDGWLRLDDASLKETPADPIEGTQCFEPAGLPDGSGAHPRARVIDPAPIAPVVAPARDRGPLVAPPGVVLNARAFSAGSWLDIELEPQPVPIDVQLSADGINWFSVALVEPADEPTRLRVFLDATQPPSVFLRVVASGPQGH
jgi:hypothetical protein